MRIGILAVQGDFEAHARMLDRLGAEHRYVRVPADLDGVDGVILPGGESGTHLKILKEEGLFEALRRFASSGAPVFGTCAGAILLAREVKNPAQESLGLADITVFRNGYGRQLASEVCMLPSALKEEPLEMVFIRAPIIESAGLGVQALALREGKAVLVREKTILAATFHPELTSDPAVHQYFLGMLRNGSRE